MKLPRSQIKVLGACFRFRWGLPPHTRTGDDIRGNTNALVFEGMLLAYTYTVHYA